MKTILTALAVLFLVGCQVMPQTNNSIADYVRTRRLFDSDWKFILADIADAQSPSFDDSHWRRLQLPHDWSIEQPFSSTLASGTGFLPGGIGWYRKTFTLPPLSLGERVSICFDGIYMNWRVWINGHDLGQRPSGFVSIQYDLTDFLNPPGTPNTIAVRVDHADSADSRFYTGSGIYRDAWLITTQSVHIAPWGVYVTTPRVADDSASVAVQTSITNENAQPVTATLLSQIESSAGIVVSVSSISQEIAPGQSVRLDQQSDVAHPALWSCDQPTLYRLVSRVIVGGQLVDRVVTPFGIRAIQFDPNRGFLLNGIKTPIKGICLHQDAGAFGAAVTEDVFARRLRLLKEMGCNAIRTSHNAPSPLLLDLCDRMGFLVMDEAFDEWQRPKKKWVFGRNNGSPSFQGYSDYFQQWAVPDIQSMVQRDRNHPCVILWSIGNEIDYSHDPYWDPRSRDYSPDQPSAAELPPIARMLKDAVKQIDSTRPVTAALATIAVSNETGLADVLDVTGYNYQEQDYRADHARFPNRVIIGSENFHTYAAWKAVLDHPFVGGQFLWTGFDYLGESPGWPIHGSPSGDLDECGFKKPMFFYRQSLWTTKPMVYLAVQGQRFRADAAWLPPPNGRQSENVVCYTNCASVELFLNGKSLGKRLLANTQDHALHWSVPYAPGTLRAVGDAGCACELTTAGPPDQIRLVPEETTIAADGRSLAFVDVYLLDASRHIVSSANNPIHFDVTGAGSIAAVDSADLATQESFRSDSRRVYHGQCLLVVRSSLHEGDISIHASSIGLTMDQTTIHVK